MITLTETTDLAPLSEPDATLARQSGDAIARFLNSEERLSLTLVGAGGRQLEATVPAAALRILAHVLEEISRGHPVTVIPRNAELTTHQAADLIGVSRPYLIKQLDAGKIPFRKVGTHRRIRYEALTAFLQREREESKKAMDDLIKYSQEIGLYDLEDAYFTDRQESEPAAHKHRKSR